MTNMNTKKKNKKKPVKRIVLGLLAFMMVKGCLGDEEPTNEMKAQAEETKVEEVVAVKEPVKEEAQYEIYKLFVHEENVYAGKPVYEVSIYGQFDLESETIKKDAMSIINKEAEIALKEHPESVMVRVFILQGTQKDYEILPVATSTFDVVDGELELRELDDRVRFPIFNKVN